jgi:integrase
MTVSELLDEWLAQKEREGKRRATLYAYSDAFRFYLKPALGHLMLRELTPLRVRDMLNALQDRGLATSTITYARTILRMALKDAVAWVISGRIRRRR